MIDSPLEAHPLRRGSSRSTDLDSHESATPPPYTPLKAPPPYSSPSLSLDSSRPRTRSIPFGAGVVFEWNRDTPRSPDEIIIATIRVNKFGRRASFDDPLPDRPTQRGFLRRLGSRILHSDDGMQNIRAVRMPRREYERHHRRDSEGNYAGTEPQQEWDDAMIDSCYGRYKHIRLSNLYQNAAMNM